MLNYRCEYGWSAGYFFMVIFFLPDII